MNTVLPILFSLIGLTSIVVIWHTVASNMGAIMELRRLMGLPDHGAGIFVTFRNHVSGYEAVSSLRRPRQLRVPAPKPVTHRLHQFAKARTAA